MTIEVKMGAALLASNLDDELRVFGAMSDRSDCGRLSSEPRHLCLERRSASGASEIDPLAAIDGSRAA